MVTVKLQFANQFLSIASVLRFGKFNIILPERSGFFVGTQCSRITQFDIESSKLQLSRDLALSMVLDLGMCWSLYLMGACVIRYPDKLSLRISGYSANTR
ncbi:hypothetical protein Hrd1104_07325 [Halorhabdus sp. CBA1104]|nr:hypothetical protein Hrd1104_07325 [Halorhabdus sp. CBA1104]